MVAPQRDTIGRYELLLELGRGGMAVLYLARARGVGGFARLFAIKRILPHLAADPVFVDMFLDEGKIAARLSHPNLCPVFELGQDRGELFLVMEYLDGVPWEALVAAAPRDGRGLALAAGVLAQACEGLHHAHTFRDVDGTAMPIVHRDVSPQNLFVSVDGACRVLDFGVSKIATDRRRTRTGVHKGKLPYMAPEQIRGELVDARADVWAIGVMLWEALTGLPLFDRATDFLTYEAITEDAIPSVNALAQAPGDTLRDASGHAARARYPAAADRVIARALARDRDQRHATARELGRDLLQLAGEVGGAAPREAIADAVTRLCGDQVAARKRAISTAVTRRPIAEAAARTEASAGDAAETASMAMRRDAIVVDHSRRPRPRWLAGALGLAAIATGIAVVIVLRGGSAPGTAPGPIATGGGQASGAPGPAPVTAAPGTTAAGDASRSSASAAWSPEARPPGTTAAGEASRSSASAAPGPAPAGRSPGVAAAGRAPGRGPAAASPAAPSSSTPSSLVTRPAAPAHGPGIVAASTRSRLPPRTPVPPPPKAAAPPPPPGEPAPPDATGAAAAPADRATGWYAIDSAPYATIFIDDRKIGDTPLDRISLAAGSHRVRAVLADGRQRTFAIDIAPDHKTSSGTLTW